MHKQKQSVRAKSALVIQQVLPQAAEGAVEVAKPNIVALPIDEVHEVGATT
jgi:hypothetical protein